MFFANEQRENVREENPGITFGQVGKLLGEKWKELSAKEKEPYDKKAKLDKERYEREKAEYAGGVSCQRVSLLLSHCTKTHSSRLPLTMMRMMTRRVSHA